MFKSSILCILSIKTSKIQYNQSGILNYILVVAYFIWPVSEAAIRAVPAPDDGYQHLIHVELPTKMQLTE